MKTFTLVGRMSKGANGFVIKTRIPESEAKETLGRYIATWRYLELEEEVRVDTKLVCRRCMKDVVGRNYASMCKCHPSKQQVIRIEDQS